MAAEQPPPPPAADDDSFLARGFPLPFVLTAHKGIITADAEWNDRISDYVFRSATIGCTPAARRAGIADASSAAKLSTSTATASIIGSHGLTPNN
jgi:hypothetical protein